MTDPVPPPDAAADLDAALAAGDSPAIAAAAGRTARAPGVTAPALAALAGRLLDAGHAGIAAPILAEVAARRPDDADAANNAAVCLIRAGDRIAAEGLLRTALRLRPAFHEAKVNLASCLAERGAIEEAAELLADALRSRGDSAAAWFNLGNLRLRLGRRREARDAFAEAVRLAPDHLGALVRLLKLTKASLDFDAAEEAHRRIDRALTGGALRTADLSALCAIGFEALFRPFGPAAEAARIEALRGRLPTAPAPARARRRDRIRVGYLSPNLGDHAVGHVTADLFAAHDRAGFEIHGFSWRDRQGDHGSHGERYRQAFDAFHVQDGAPAEAIAAAIADRGIDLLVDLDGLMGARSPAILAWRPAPVQAFWLGHAGGLGLPLADYLIADGIVVPRGEEAGYAERIVRLPGCYHCAARHAVGSAPPRAALGLPDGAVVLAALHNPEKIDRTILGRWMDILRQTPGAVLWLADPFDSAEMRGAAGASAAAVGVDPGRIVFAGWVPDRGTHLARLAAADLFLDTITVNASSTALDALQAGVPMVAVRGSRFADRISSSMLAAVGLPDLVAPDLDGYVALAHLLATDGPRRDALRARLAAGRDAGRLFDSRAFVAGLEAAYGLMVERSRSGMPPAAFDVRGE